MGHIRTQTLGQCAHLVLPSGATIVKAAGPMNLFNVAQFYSGYQSRLYWTFNFLAYVSVLLPSDAVIPVPYSVYTVGVFNLRRQAKHSTANEAKNSNAEYTRKVSHIQKGATMSCNPTSTFKSPNPTISRPLQRWKAPHTSRLGPASGRGLSPGNARSTCSAVTASSAVPKIACG